MYLNHTILRTKRAISGTRFNSRAGELKHLRFKSNTPDAVPRLVAQSRNNEAIDWGGAALQPGDYEVLFDGPGPLPEHVKLMLRNSGLL